MATVSGYLNSKSMQKCAFCKSYYDPSCEAISPKTGVKGMWQYKTGIKKPCTSRNIMANSHSVCPAFQCKL